MNKTLPTWFGSRPLQFAIALGFVFNSCFAGELTGGESATVAERLPAAERSPNIVLIMADDLGYECIGANGGTSYQTPVLDRLAATGMRFNHCYSQPLCTPSRVQIMTGIYNVRNYERFGLLPTNQTTFAQLLKKSGYQTCVVGKWQLGGEFDQPNKFGFDEYSLWYLQGREERYPNPRIVTNGKAVQFENGEYGPDVVSDFACDFMERNKDRPFLVYYPMILTHCPFCPTPDSEDWDPANTGSKTYKGKPKDFGSMVTYMDKTIGKLVDKLESLGLRENTLILFTGDNGTDKPIVSMMSGMKIAGGKGKMTDAGTRVPLIANWPNTIAKTRVCNDLVDFSDFLPTLIESGKGKVPADLSIDGQSFLPQLMGKPGRPREWIYCWYARNGGTEGQQWARDQRYKLYPNGRLFDIQNDRSEQNPIPLSTLTSEQKPVYEKLKKALLQFANARPESVARAGKKQKSNRK